MQKSGLFQVGSMMLLCAMGGSASAEVYQVDTAHSDISFKVRHMGIANVTGKFQRFGGTFEVDPKNLKATKGNLTIDVTSISTGIAKRDAHLQAEDFFDAAKFPEIRFVSKEVRDVNMKDSTATLIGDLTMRGITKEIPLKIKGGGIIKDGSGNERAGFTASGKVDRFDYGIKWNSVLESGQLVVSRDVDLNLSFEGVRKLGAEAPAKTEKGAAKPAAK